MAKFVLYTRVSTREQGESGLGLESQLQTCRAYVERMDGEIVGEFSDVKSGSSRNRKGLLSALECARKNGATLVFAKLDRLARDAQFAHEIRNSGVELYFCDFPSLNSLMFGILVAVAQYERELGVKRTKDALDVRKQQLKEKGSFYNKKGELCYGFGNPRYKESQPSAAEAGGLANRMKKEADPNWQIARNTAIDMRNRGDNNQQIANTLNGIGIRTRKGGLWSRKTVADLLS